MDYKFINREYLDSVSGGDPLQKLSEYIDWSIFEAPLDQAFRNETKDLLKGGRPPFSKLILFKALIIQSLYNLSDDQLEFQIVDRASFTYNICRCAQLKIVVNMG
ncbi:MAG: transposase [Bacteroidales bacterium]